MFRTPGNGEKLSDEPAIDHSLWVDSNGIAE